MVTGFDFAKVEKKWQKKWEQEKAFVVHEGKVPSGARKGKLSKLNENSKKEKYYVLEMFPYPSASYLHMGHVRNYTMGDVIARLKRMQGFNVLYPMGYDSFGLPAENAAKKAGEHPKKYTEFAIKKIMEYQKKLGNSYDWTRMIATHEPSYYQWNQLFFLKFLEKGLVYRKEAPVNWCSSCNAVLANEEVVKGCCWRHEETEVETKNLEQWFFKTTDYADELLKDLDKLEWSNQLKALQRNWIGRSEGTEIVFSVGNKDWPVFTTRPDTLMGVTFLVVSAQHLELDGLVTADRKEEVAGFLENVKKAETEENNDFLEKEGVFTGSYAEHPLTGEKIPIWAGNFVVADYGSGMVMAVPAHDQRDHEFARKYDLPITEVIVPNRVDKENPPVDGKKSGERKNVHAIVRDPKTGKFLFLKSHKHGWTTLPMGGIEKGESVVEAAEREVKEEAGYVNLKFVKLLGGAVRAEYFAKHKDENRVAFTNAVMFDLIDKKKITLPKEEQGEHEEMWLTKEEIVYPDVCHAELGDWLDRWDVDDGAYTGEGVLVNSEGFDGLASGEAKEHVTNALKMKKKGKKTVQYKLRDWLISRQRYWGTPIPIIYCDVCGIVPLKEKDLPLELPEDVTFKGVGNPLLTSKSFLETSCPSCGKPGKRETDTMGGFMDSSWYFLRFADPLNTKKPFDLKKARYWMSVDQYVGGIEHAVGHLIYSRFFTKALRDLGFLEGVDEPFTRLFNQGYLYGADGRKMSKSYPDAAVTQEEVSKKYGIDSARLFLLFVAAPDSSMEWNDKGMEGVSRFVKRVLGLRPGAKSDKRSEHYRNRFVKEITADIENFRFNLAIIKLMKWRDVLSEQCERKSYADFVKMFSVFAPHIAEELWEKLGGKGLVSLSKWPEVDEKKIDMKLEAAEEAGEKTVKDIMHVLGFVKEKSGADPEEVHVYVMPQELKGYNAKALSDRVGVPVIVWSVADKKKVDPDGKSKKAKPGKPGIWVR